MKRLIFISLIAAAFQCGYAQTTAGNTLRPKKAISFSFAGLNLGGGLGGKYWLGSQTAIRIELNFSFEQYKEAASTLSSLSSGSSTTETTTRYQIAPTVNIEKHFQVDKSVSPYFGAGAAYNYYLRKQDVPNSENNETSYSGNVFWGVEYWLSENVSLAGEQTISIYYQSETGFNTFSIKNSTSNLRLYIYF